MEEKLIKPTREVIILTSEQLRYLAQEETLIINEKEIPIKSIEHNYEHSGRHQEYHHMIFKRLSDNKFFKADYSTSVKDTMGWDECNWQKEYEIEEVFPNIITITTYQ